MVAERLVQDTPVVLAFTPVTEAWELRQVVVLVRLTYRTLELQGAHVLARHQEPLAAVAACPELLALRALPLLLAGYSGKAEAVAALALLARAVLVVLAVVALAAVAVAQHAVHTLLALVA